MVRIENVSGRFVNVSGRFVNVSGRFVICYDFEFKVNHGKVIFVKLKNKLKEAILSYDIDFLPVREGEKGGDAICLRYGNFNNRNEYKIIVIDGGTIDSGKNFS